MRRTRAVVYYRDGRPVGYTLYCDGQGEPLPVPGTDAVTTTFEEAYRLFAVVRANYHRDGTPSDLAEVR